MKVLISNDDGPPSSKESPFILPFIQHCENLGWQVKVCLPDSQKSWIAKSFMIKEEIQLRYYNRRTNQICNQKENDNDFILLSGTPATCVNIALNHLFKDEEFDLVIGGPNFGRNISTIFTLASGTVGAAMEAVLNKKKAVSISFCFCNQRQECITNCCEMATDIIQQLYNKELPWPKHGLFNINIPMLDYKCPIHLTRFHQASYGSLFEKTEKKGGEPVSFKFAPDFTAINSDKDGLPGTDKWALMNKCASVTPMTASFQTAMDSLYEQRRQSKKDKDKIGNPLHAKKDDRVCLPDEQKSWISKSFIITDEIQLRYYNRETKHISNEKQNDNDSILLSDTPATCVNIALHHLFQDEEFDLVIGGRNFDNNITTLFTLASGTIGAAMEAVLNKKKSVAISFGVLDQRPECIKNCCEMTTDVIEHVYNHEVPWPEHGLFNINISMVDYKCPIHLTEFHKANYGSLFEKKTQKKGESITFKFEPDLTPIEADMTDVEGTDKWAIVNNCVSVTPMIAAFQTTMTSVNDIDYNFDSINEKYSTLD